jgi:hypothetical protein
MAGPRHHGQGSVIDLDARFDGASKGRHRAAGALLDLAGAEGPDPFLPLSRAADPTPSAACAAGASDLTSDCASRGVLRADVARLAISGRSRPPRQIGTR